MNGANVTQHMPIAIALALLSHKPPQQSISSYILDLKAGFPVAEKPIDETGLDNPWRTRALALEEENEKLKINAQKHKLEILALKAVPTGAGESNPDQDSSQAPRKKKKVAQPVAKPFQDRLDLRALVKDIRCGSRLPALQDSLDILTSFRTIRLSCDSGTDDKDRETILIPNVKRSLSALGNLLSAVLARDGSVVATSSRVDLTNCLCNLLLTLLESTLPLAPREAVLLHIMGDITMYVVRPIIRAFQPLSVHEITWGIKESGDRKKNDVDVRPNLLSIFRRLIGCLRTMKERTRDLREFMVFETAKEIETLWSTATPQESQEQRVAVLARKDTLWYQCSVIHIALDRFPATRQCKEDERSFLCAEAVRVLADLLRHFERGSPVDEVAKNMVLGVLEKAWLSGLHEPPPDE